MITTRCTPAAVGTPRDGRTIKQDARSWYEGYRAGRLGQGLFKCPHPAGTTESWSWTSGYIEGKDRGEKHQRRA